jgi:hypothetical protein
LNKRILTLVGEKRGTVLEERSGTIVEERRSMGVASLDYFT